MCVYMYIIVVLLEWIWNSLAVALVSPTIDDTASLGSPARWVVYPPGSTLGYCLSFPCGE